jgi:integrase
MLRNEHSAKRREKNQKLNCYTGVRSLCDSERPKISTGQHVGLDMDKDQIKDVLLDLARRVGSEAKSHTLDEAIERWGAQRCVRGLVKPRTLRAYQRARALVSERWGALDVAQTNWQAEAAELYAARGKSALLYLEVLRGAVLVAMSAGWRSDPHGIDSVIAKCKYAPREAVYTEAQLRAFLVTLDELDRLRPLRLPSREVLRCLVYTGARMMEIAGLSWDEVGPGYLTLRERHGRTLKSGPRTVPLCAEAQVVIARQRRRNAWVFPGDRSHIASSTIQRSFGEAKRAAKLQDGTVHTLRHSYATVAIRNGVPQIVVQKLLGHSSAWVTQRYIHADRSDAGLGTAVVANAIGGGR